ncbi:MAG: hypothetical protein ACOYMB_03430 [Patescibacteria group bacterium]
MKKVILIVQSIPEWLDILKMIFRQEFPEASIIATDSFDFAVDLAHKQKEINVVCSNMFYDESSIHRGRVIQKVDDSLKDSNMLAKLIKELNTTAKVFCFSGNEPANKEYLDGYVIKDENNNYKESLSKLLEVIR